MQREAAESEVQSFGPAETRFTPSDMNSLVNDFDWSTTPLGPAAEWPDSLTAAVRILLTSRFAMWMAWGPELTFLYNDAYRQMTLGKKHPWALGRPAAEVWSEIWKDIGPRIQRVLETGKASWDEELLLILGRNGYPEETYHTFSYSPLAGSDGQITGMLCVVMEDTTRVIGERQLLSLRTLAAELGEAITGQEVLASIERGLQANEKDLPFTLTYLFDETGMRLNLVCRTGIEAGHPAACPMIEPASTKSGWPIDQVLAEESAVTVGLSKHFADLPGGMWGKAPSLARLVPIARQGQDKPAGVLIAALNPYRQLDTAYAGYLDLMAGQIAASFASANAYEEERKRAEALAEIDRAKTAFFTNISHEFRTPLTLLLGPLEDTLAERELPPPAMERLTLAHRNSLRLLKLVNALLDFSRFEAGRVSAVYEPVDLSTYTADLASVFRSAIERAGMELIIDCPKLEQPVYIDREMWEKIVLNLLSNAFKFTMSGQIKVRLKPAGKNVELTVQDTGSGIAAAELPHIFERFYRVSGVQGRSHEGSGIGLALVRELVKVHGGTVRVESEPGRGSAFTVSIPFGLAHSPAEAIGSARTLATTATGPQAYVAEALHWLPDAAVSDDPQEVNVQPPSLFPAEEGSRARSRIVIADDNADMREYLRRLLASHYGVEAVPDGEAAFQSAVERPPDLIITDVMMPKLDGFGLLKALRADARTATVPVMLLSARAGEESRMEGIAAGADDYVVKPFAARELVARLEARLLLSRMRRESELALREREQRFRTLAENLPQFVWLKDLTEGYVYCNRSLLDYVGDAAEALRVDALAYVHPDDLSRTEEKWKHSLATGDTYLNEYRLRRHDGVYRYFLARAVPMRNEAGQIERWLGTSTDIHDQKLTEEALRQSEERFRTLVTATSNTVFRMSPNWSEMRQLRGGQFVAQSETPTRTWLQEYIHPDDQPRVLEVINEAIRTKGIFELEHRVLRTDGSLGWTFSRAIPLKDANAEILEWFGTASDVTERKRTEDALLRSEKLATLGRLAATIAHEINNPLEAVTNTLYLARVSAEDPASQLQYLDMADDELKRIAHITRQTLGFYRESSAPAAVSVGIVLDAAEDLLRAKIKAKRASIEKQYDLDRQVAAVPGELRQVFSNLLANSLDAIEEQGAIKLRISKSTSVTNDRSRIRVTIADNGKGIDAATLPRIFEPLFTTKEATGSGLGLWVSKQIIEKHGGSIRVRSSPRKPRSGTVISIFLPAMEEPATEGAAAD
ncbi:MAG: ATP-binding protein [Candidatus Korobacteraceae bacterium]